MVPTTIGNNQQTNDGAASDGRGARKTLTVKASLGSDMRRLKMRCSELWADLRAKLEGAFDLAAPESNPSWRITWVDEDRDHITVQTEADWQECIRHVHGLVIRLHIAEQAVPAGAELQAPQAMAMAMAENVAMLDASARLVVPPERAPAAPAVAPPPTCHLTMIVDRSGSMRSLGDTVLEGIRTYLQELAASDESKNVSTTVMFSTFDHAYEVKHNGISAADAQHAITQSDIEPRGMTALHDAIGQGLSDTEQAVAAMPLKPDKVVVFILTDGEENSSRKWTARSVKKQIAKLEAENFEFFFAAAGQDALDTGARMGLSAGDCITWSGDRGSASATFSACVGAAIRSRGGGSKAFTSSERQSTMTPSVDAFADATATTPAACKPAPTARRVRRVDTAGGAVPSPASFPITVTIVGAGTHTLEVEGGDSVKDVAVKIESETGISRDDQTLIFGGRILMNNGMTLSDLSVRRASSVFVTLQRKYGCVDCGKQFSQWGQCVSHLNAERHMGQPGSRKGLQQRCRLPNEDGHGHGSTK